MPGIFDDLGAIIGDPRSVEQKAVNDHLREVWIRAIWAQLSSNSGFDISCVAEAADRTVVEYEKRFVHEKQRGRWRLKEDPAKGVPF